MRALELLNYLAALDDDGNLTPLGAIMVEFTIDPQVSSFFEDPGPVSLRVAFQFKCTHEMLTIAATLSGVNPKLHGVVL